MSKELFDVYLYENTGFNSANVPHSLDLLNSVTPLRVDAIYKLQPYPLDNIKVNGKFIDYQACDYCILKNESYGSIGYNIVNITMLNTNTIMFSLSIDVLGTIGLGYNNTYQITSGWVIRRHYAKSEDTLFANIIPEQFSLAFPTKINRFEIGYTDERTNLVASTVNIADNQGRLNLAIDRLEYNSMVITKPIVTGARRTTEFVLPENKTIGGLSQNIDCLAVYDTNDLEDDMFNKLQAYGLLDVITASYQVPTEMLSVSNKESGGFYSKISGAGKGLTSGLKFEYATAKNKKVFSIGSSYTLMSIISGDSETFEPWEIRTQGFDSPRLNLMCDLTPGGKPYCRPEIYHSYIGEGMTSYFKCVEGASWSNIPIITDGKNGYIYNQVIENINNNISNKRIRSLQSSLISNSTTLTNAIDNNDNYQTINNSTHNIESRVLGYGDEYYRLIDRAYAPVSSKVVQRALTNPIGAITDLAGAFFSGDFRNPTIDRMNANQLISDSQLHSQSHYLNKAKVNNNNVLMNRLADNKRESLNGQLSDLYNQYSIQTSIIGLERAKELAQFNSYNMITPPNISFAYSSGLQNFLGNGFLFIQETLDQRDINRLDDYFTMFGYAVSEKFQISFLKNRQYYNFIQMSNVRIKSIGGKLPTYILDSVLYIMNAGVRVWHVLPTSISEEQYYSNYSI